MNEPIHQRPLEGFRVVDLGLGPVTGITTMAMADFGADVIDVEPLNGDPFRDLPHAPTWLRGKRTVRLNLREPEHLKSVKALVREADVFVTHLLSDAAEEFELDYANVSKENAGLVYCRITGFGSTGPYRDYPGYEGVVAAKSGRMWALRNIANRDGPSFTPLEVGCHLASQGALAGTLAALIERENSGRGDLVEASLLRSMMAFDLAALVRTQFGGPLPDVTAAPLSYHPLPTADGRWIQMGNLLQHLFDNFVVAAGMADIFAEQRFQGPWGLWKEADREEFRDRMLSQMRTKTAAEWIAVFSEHGSVAATEFHNSIEAMNDPDIIQNGHISHVQHADLGEVTTLGVLARLDTTPGAVPAEANDAIVPVEHIRSEWEERTQVPDLAPASVSKSAGPLAGHTILEFATIIAAPLGASMLADLGARVIKVEPPGGDPFRGMGDGSGIFALKTNAGKESICLDLKDSRAHDIVHRLVKVADAVIHNYRPGVPERLGIGYEQCAELRPDLVYVSVNGYGPSGPGARRPATHPIPGAALGGAVRQSAGAHLWPAESLEDLRALANRLYRSNEISPDPNTSAVVASATALALLARKRFGLGQQVFVDMFGANTYANAFEFINYESRPTSTLPDRELLGVGPTYRLYETHDGWVFLALLTDAEFERFCEMADLSEILNDPRFQSGKGRQQHADGLEQALAEAFKCRDAKDWEDLLAPEGIGCVRADNVDLGSFWMGDPHVVANKLTEPVSHSRWNPYVRWGANVDLVRNRSVLRGAPLAGENVDELLYELGYTADERRQLRDAGVVWSEDVSPQSR